MSFNPIHAALSSQRRLGGFHQTNFGIPFKDFCDFGDFCVSFAPFAFAPVFIAAQAKPA